MDHVEDIKSRLSIEELVGQYRALTKKGHNFLCLCPFHNDTRPSMVVSPDKGIAYCFACNSGGDIFSFYQKIEGVDFRQALIDLADRTGVQLPKAPVMTKETKDEKERLRECLESAKQFFQRQLSTAQIAKDYLQKRGVPAEQIEQFGLGYAPDSFSETYEHLLKEGFSKKEILLAGLGVQKDLAEGRIYDRFRNRVMFPIHDSQGRIAGFGGRTLGEGDAKYINSAEGPLYKKSEILYGFHYAKDAIRTAEKVIMVEGYFDVLACHRVGVQNVVAVSGTALTEQHVKLLKRSSETVLLCLDQDRAGREASERAYYLCCAGELHVQAAVLPEKDPGDLVNSNPDLLRTALQTGAMPFVEHIIALWRERGVTTTEAKREAAAQILPLIRAAITSVEQEEYIRQAAAALGATETALRDDMQRMEKREHRPAPAEETSSSAPVQLTGQFSQLEVALGLFLLYPQHRVILDELIEPTEGFTALLYNAIKSLPPTNEPIDPENLHLPPDARERVSILQLFCEEHDFARWSENLAIREIRKNCHYANRTLLRGKLAEITAELVAARRDGRRAEEERLSTQYQHLLKLAQMAM
jgi:DNA primase